jgi:hypothetical protein
MHAALRAAEDEFRRMLSGSAGAPLALADVQAQQERVYQGGVARFGAVPRSQEAEQKGAALLREWLSPEQTKQYDRGRHFEVIGSDTGKRYRIHYGCSMNIEELEADGRHGYCWCFVPAGALVAGDVMLAQKIALETFESDALAKANRFRGLPAQAGTRYFPAHDPMPCVTSDESKPELRRAATIAYGLVLLIIGAVLCGATAISIFRIAHL